MARGVRDFASKEYSPKKKNARPRSCDDADSTGDVATATATFRVAEAETVTCVFTNCSDAVATVNLSGHTATGVEIHEACDTLTADSFAVGSTAEVTFRAGNRIILQGGFSVAQGGRFSAQLIGQP